LIIIKIEIVICIFKKTKAQIMNTEYQLILKGLEDCDTEMSKADRKVDSFNNDLLILNEEITHYEIGRAHKETREEIMRVELYIQIYKNRIKLIKIMKLVYIEMNLVYTSIQHPKTARGVYQKLQNKFEIQFDKIRILLRKQYALRVEHFCEMPDYDPKENHDHFLDKLDELKDKQTKMESICRLGESLADRRI